MNMWYAHVQGAEYNIPVYVFVCFLLIQFRMITVVIQWQRGLFQEVFLTQKSFWLLQRTFGVDKRYLLVFLPAKKLDLKHKVFQANVTMIG